MVKKDKQWRHKFKNLMDNCQQEVKRTTEIGKKMLSASKTNSCLHESYEELGALVMKAIKAGELEWSHPKVKELIAQIENCENDLNTIENEVNKIRFPTAPIDISKQNHSAVKKEN